jgi:hypothetical protein
MRNIQQILNWLWAALLLGTLLWLHFGFPGAREPIEADALLNLLAERSFKYFEDYQDIRTGLVRDGSQWQPASISATGFALGAFVIGAERGWIARDEAESRALRAIETCLQLASTDNEEYSKYGFLYHFVEPSSGRRFRTRFFVSEVSIIDTAILVAGALTAGEYFGGRVREAAIELYSRIQWDKFLDPQTNLFYGAWTPEQGFTDWKWDYYTDEIILISLLAIGSPTHPVSPDVFYAWKRVPVTVGGKTFIRSWHGGLFTYQCAHLWINLKGLQDAEGVDWWENSVKATLANRELAIRYSTQFKSYGPNSWGVTPAFHPRGVRGYEGRLSLMAEGRERPFHDGTVSPSGPAGSLPFTPEYSKAALLHFYRSIPRLWGPYGFKSSFNLDQGWVAPIYNAIEIATTLLAIDAYQRGTVHRAIMQNPFIRRAISEAGFSPIAIPGANP